MNKLLTGFLILYSIVVYSILFFVIIKNKFFIKEGFNTYFRQTVRPQLRNIRDAQETVTYHFNSKFKDFGRALGFY